MGNPTTVQTYERREKLKSLWANGSRKITKIAEALGSTPQTIKRDLVILRKQAYGRIKRERNLELIRLEEDAGLLNDIEHLNALIQSAKGAPEVAAKLIDKKLRARQQRAELWGLVKTGINVHAEARAGAQAGAKDDTTESNIEGARNRIKRNMRIIERLGLDLESPGQDGC